MSEENQETITQQDKEPLKKLVTPKYIRDSCKAYYARNKDNTQFKAGNAARSKEWRQKNKEKHNEYQKAWREKKKKNNKRRKRACKQLISKYIINFQISFAKSFYTWIFCF